MKQRKIQGEAAAALATLKLKENNPQTKQPITLDEAADRDLQSTGCPTENAKHLRQNLSREPLSVIKADPHVLYVDGAPADSIHQARNGDCWLLATIGALIHRDRHDLRE